MISCDLALARTVAGEQEVLHHLLGDGRGAAQPPALGRLDDRGRDAARVEARMLVEVAILGGDEGLPDLVGDLVDRGEDAALAGELVHELALARIDPAEREGLVLGELGVVGQVPAVDHEDAGERAETEDQSERQPAEEKPEKPREKRPTTIALSRMIAAGSYPGGGEGQSNASVRQSRGREGRAPAGGDAGEPGNWENGRMRPIARAARPGTRHGTVGPRPKTDCVRGVGG
jgi:hypothetical protein